MRRLTLILALFIPLSANAESALPFMKALAGDATLPRPWGISLDFYTMDQDYDIERLQFDLPGVSLGDPSLLMVTNEVEHFDLKADVWLLPFLNVFGLIGRMDADTVVDFTKAPISGLPFPLKKLPVAYDGTVLGLGFTLAYGTDKWFTSVTTTYTDTDISGDLDSAVESLTIQPRVGLVRNNWVFWGGGMYLDVDESHEGVFEIPGLGGIPFAVDLATSDKWNYTLGTNYFFSDRTNFSLEIGFGDRTHTLASFNVRF